jgi:hypothetical protein
VIFAEIGKYLKLQAAIAQCRIAEQIRLRTLSQRSLRLPL